MTGYEKLLKILNSNPGVRIIIQTHDFPDPDAAASAFGLQKFLQHYGFESDIVYNGEIAKPNLYHMINLFNIEMTHIKYADIKKSDFVIIVDAQRANTNITDCGGTVIGCIDHHPSFARDKYRFNDIRMVGACSTIIASWFKATGIEMSNELATALLYGIKVDTDTLTRGVKDLDIDIYAMLHRISDCDVITSLATNKIEAKDLKAYGAALQNVVIRDNLGFAEIPFSCPDAIIAMISDFILDVDVVSMSVVYSKREEGLKFSVRSKVPKIMNAGKVINKSLSDIGSGGGHPTMAGGFVPANVYKNRSVDYIREHIQQKFIECAKNEEMLVKSVATL